MKQLSDEEQTKLVNKSFEDVKFVLATRGIDITQISAYERNTYILIFIEGGKRALKEIKDPPLKIEF